MSVLCADITQLWLCQSFTLKETTCLSPPRPRDDFYLSREKICQKWSTAVSLVSFLVWMCIHKQLYVKLNSTGAVSAIKTVVWWDSEPVTSCCGAHFILWPFSHFHLCPLRPGLAHQSCRNTSSVSTDISKYQYRVHDAHLSTNNVRLRASLWCW